MSTTTVRWKKPAASEVRKQLTPLQYEVTQNAATEPPFRNEFWDNKSRGIYVDVVTGEPLFSSADKFRSGTGWPSFVRPIAGTRIVEKRDGGQGMARVEVLSASGDSHLGHLFDDGPKPTGMRYCINSASLRFIPVDQLQTEGYGEYRAALSGADALAENTDNACAAPAPKDDAPGCQTTLETAVLAGGCFWGMEEIIRKIPGVLETEVGYTGGHVKDPTYGDMTGGHSGHAEAIRVLFDPAKLSYADLLENWFFKMHDPTTKNRQGNDVGSQYRSAIFFTSKEQAVTARAVTDKVNKAGSWRSPIVTEIVKASTFTPAENYHQDYLEQNPGGYTCHYMRD